MKIEGDKIILRDWEIADLDEYRYWNTDKHLWMDFDAPYFKKISAKEWEVFIPKLEKRIRENNFPSIRNRLVIADKQTNQFLGTVSWYFQEKETNWKSLGIIIFNEKYWTKGIGSEAFKLWIDYVFNSDKSLNRIDLRTWSGNKRMIRLAEKLGFKQEACFRSARIVNNEYYDSIAMGVLRSEWVKPY